MVEVHSKLSSRSTLDETVFPNFDKRRQVSSSAQAERWQEVAEFLTTHHLETLFEQPGDYLALCCGDGVAEQDWANRLSPQSQHVFLDKQINPTFSAAHPELETIQAPVFAYLAEHAQQPEMRHRFRLVTLLGVEYLLMDPADPQRPEILKVDTLAPLLAKVTSQPALVVIAPAPPLNQAVWAAAGWEVAELGRQVTVAFKR